MTSKIFSNLYSYIFLFILILFSTIIIASRSSDKTGIGMFLVRSGSMEPTIPTGSIIVTKKQQNIEIGDIITFKSPNIDKIPVTHRIIDIKKDTDGEKIFTQGDANKGADLGNIEKSAILGTVLFHIPYLGYIVSIAQTKYGMAILLLIPALILLIGEIKKSQISKHDIPNT